MTRDPAWALQTSVFETLCAHPDLSQDFIFDRVPNDTPLPWIVIGNDTLFAEYEAANLTRANVTIDVFAATKKQLKLLIGAVRSSLDRNLDIQGYLCGEGQWDETQYVTEPDGKTQHAVMSFDYLLFPTE